MSVLPIQYVRPIAVYVPTQPTADFPVPWAFDDLEDLQVTVDGVLQTGWTLINAQTEMGFYSAATIRLPTLVTGRVVIARFTAAEQEAVFPSGGAFRVDVLNRALGRLWMADQDLVERSNRALYVPVGEESPGALPSRANRAGRLLGFDDNGDLTVTTTVPDFDVPLDVATEAAERAEAAADAASGARISVEALAPAALAAASVATTASALAAALAANFYEVVQPVTTTIESFMNAGGPYDFGDLLPIDAPFAIERLAATRIDLSRSSGSIIDLGSVA